MNPSESAKTWLITGCSTGFGRELARRVLDRGDRCVVTARDESSIAEFAKRFPKTAYVVSLDVTDADGRERVVKLAESACGGVDVLVNNAGHGYLAAIEEGEDEEIRAMFETNFFGLAALTRRVLPGMRARRRGHIVNISSVGGLIGNPASGYYCASKFAVEGLSEALSKEVGPLGIHVTIVEPGPFRTDFQGRSIHGTKHAIDDYAQTVAARRQQLKSSDGRQPGDPVRAADAIVAAVEASAPPLHLVLGGVGVERVRDKLTSFLRSMDEWDAVSRGADFPEGGFIVDANPGAKIAAKP